MNSNVPAPGETPRRRLHPLVATAAASVIVLCAVAVASLLGWLPAPWAESPASSAQTPVNEAQIQADAERARASRDTVASESAATQGSASAQSGTGSSPAAPSPSPVKAAGATQAAPATQTTGRSTTVCANCGVVETIRAIQVPQKNEGSNVVGTVAGGVVGGVVGHQFGGGSGKDALTVLGAVGGALAGHEIERNIRQQQTVTRYELTVRMDNGSKRTFHSSQPFAYASGDSVRVENDQLLPR